MPSVNLKEPATLTLCSNARLARSLRLAEGEKNRNQGLAQWTPRHIMTLAQWLEETIERSVLVGDIPPRAIPGHIQDGLSERLLWKQAIKRTMREDPALALFDVAGMAQAASEANALMLEWGISFPSEGQSEETYQFLRWRDDFRGACQQLGLMEPARLRDVLIDVLQRGAGRLPSRIELAGFDRLSPQEKRLLDVLQTRGVEVARLELGLTQPSKAVQVACENSEVECRAAIAWAAEQLKDHPSARLAIVVPELASLRTRLASALDDTLHPDAIHPGMAGLTRCYDFSLGEPLSSQAVVACALSILRLGVSPRRIPQNEMGLLLRDVFWSASITEADARASLEALMRRRLPANLQLPQLLRLARSESASGAFLTRLVQHLDWMQQEIRLWPRQQLPSTWASSFCKLLDAAAWPGERGLSSAEFQTRRAWSELLNEFAGFDTLLGPMSPGEALGQLSSMCHERIFQPESENVPNIQVMGMLEAAAEPLDGVWVMGMNDHIWPPPSRPNPLIPARFQRAAGASNSCGRVQAEFARDIQQRLLRSAHEVIFSWSLKDGDRELRPSPLLAGMEYLAESPPVLSTLAELLAQPSDLESLEDHVAPAVSAHERVRGGTGLLKAQAICPAWAFFQYRLGARALDEAVEGLDAMDRGNLLHAVLQCFWKGRDSGYLHALDVAGLQSAIAEAVENGIEHFSANFDQPLPAAFLQLERQRQQKLLGAWLAFEKQRPPFAVEECEHKISVDIAGLTIALTLDRVDALENGSLVVIDYKTGANVSHKSWAQERITEPQLPMYASMALSDKDVVAVCFAKVRVDEQKFIGVAADAGVVPGVDALQGVRNVFPEEQFPGWSALLENWKARITAIACEIQAGEAAVRFDDETELRDCEVKPLLRLPERKLQMERG